MAKPRHEVSLCDQAQHCLQGLSAHGLTQGGFPKPEAFSSSPQISMKLREVVSRRKEMNEKWEARWERLCICECSLGAREPGGAGGMMSERVGFYHCLQKSPYSTIHHQSSRAKGLGVPTEVTWTHSPPPNLIPGWARYRVRSGEGSGRAVMQPRCLT